MPWDKTYMDSNTLNRLLAANLESLMAEKGLNPSGWAKAANLNHTAVRDILSMKVKNPTYRTLLSLAEVAGVDVRRITVGHGFDQRDKESAQILDLLFQLDQKERDFLLTAAKAQVAARGGSD